MVGRTGLLQFRERIQPIDGEIEPFVARTKRPPRRWAGVMQCVVDAYVYDVPLLPLADGSVLPFETDNHRAFRFGRCCIPVRRVRLMLAAAYWNTKIAQWP